MEALDMNTSAGQGPGQTITYQYGAGIRAAIIGVCFLAGSLYISPEFLSDQIEWHLWSTEFPLIIPNIIIKSIWWILFALSIFVLVASTFPKATIAIGETKVVVQNPLTRNFMTVAFDEVLDFTVTNNYLFLVDRNNRKVVITRLNLSRKAYKEIIELLAQRIQRSRSQA